jgi:hypothetical protein
MTLAWIAPRCEVLEANCALGFFMVTEHISARQSLRRHGVGANRRFLLAVTAHASLEPREHAVACLSGGTQGRLSLRPSDNAAENFVKVVQPAR